MIKEVRRMRARRFEAVRTIIIAIAVITFGVAVLFDDVVIPQSYLFGGVLVLAGILLVASIAVSAKPRDRD